jgi:hypothetical protein
MAKIIAFCGVNCAECPPYLAHKNDDNELRAKTAEEWSKMFEARFKPQDINCVGCLETEGPQIGNCAECEIRRCAIQRNLANCAYCPDYACEKLTKFFEMYPSPKANLDQIRASL